jgi:hypothetical protein
MQKDTPYDQKISMLRNNRTNQRNRTTYFFLILLTMAIGLTTRKIADQLPKLVNLYLGDILWALMIFLITGFIFNKRPLRFVGLFAIVFCYLIEISQLYHKPWIDTLRSTTLGALVLGHGFLWSDILAYSIGVGLGLIMEKLLLSNR